MDNVHEMCYCKIGTANQYQRITFVLPLIKIRLVPTAEFVTQQFCKQKFLTDKLRGEESPFSTWQLLNWVTDSPQFMKPNTIILFTGILYKNLI
jgi:hypothetical protein